MKTFYSIILVFLFFASAYPYSNQPMVIARQGDDINVVVSNMCEYYSMMMVCEGDSAAGIHPVFASANCMSQPHFTIYDSLLLFQNTKFLTFANYGAAPYGVQRMFVADESTILSFDATYLTYGCDSIVLSAQDTLITDSIVSGTAQPNYVIYIRNSFVTDNFVVYDLNLAFTFSMHLNMTPMFISSNQSASLAAVVGVNQNNETVLNLIDITNQQIIKDTILGIFASKPTSVMVRMYDTYIISQPGDSVINLFKYKYTTGLADSLQLYAGSGLNTGTWESYRYHFQPAADINGNNSDRKVFILDTYFMTVDTIDIARKLKLLYAPVGVSYTDYPFIMAVDSLNPYMAIYYSDYNYWQADSIYTPSAPQLFAPDFRCPVKISEYDDASVQWNVYPNPSADNFKLSASGLICGRNYDLDIIDQSGKVVYKETVHAKMTVVLPTSDFEPGIYFVRIHTLKGFITQEIIKQ